MKMPNPAFTADSATGPVGRYAAARKLGLRIDFSNVIAGLCIGLHVLGLALDPGALFSNFSNPLQFLSPAWKPALSSGMTGSQPIFGYGLWWTPVTAIYLHGGLLHIFLIRCGFASSGRSSRNSLDRFASSSYSPLPASSDLSPLRFLAALSRWASGSIFGLLAAAIAYGCRVGSPFTRQFMQGRTHLCHGLYHARRR